MSRIRSLDGLRGVAVLAVLASHAIPLAHGGFLGVDVFFVLSGYLITSLLLAERERTGRIDFAAFYRRRLARLAPAYLLMIALAVPLMLGPLHDRLLWPVPLAVGVTAVYGANWASVVSIDALGPLMHTWSLSVEEQFYLIWPVAFVALVRRGRSLTRWLAGAAVLVVLARLAGWELTHRVWVYTATVTHGDGLLVGCLLAVLLARRPADRLDRRTTRRQAWVGVGVLALLTAVLTVDTGATYLFGLTLAVLSTAALVRHLLTGADDVLTRTAGRPVLVFVGRISYGLYLYHLPIFELVQSWRLGFFPSLLLEFGGTLAVATLSWYGLERPVQRWVTHRWPRTPDASPSVSASPSASPSASASASDVPDSGQKVPVPHLCAAPTVPVRLAVAAHRGWS